MVKRIVLLSSMRPPWRERERWSGAGSHQVGLLREGGKRGIPVFVSYVYGHTYSKSIDQPGKVANPARGQLNRKNEYFPVRVRA